MADHDTPANQRAVFEEGDGQYQALCAGLGYQFHDEALLELALTHRSFSAENDGAEPNERLEFLGDAVLGLAVADSLFHDHADRAEGFLAKSRADLVSARSLGRVARSLGLGDVLRLGKGEELSGGRQKESILADAMEAVIAAVFLDGGWEAAQELVDRQFSGGFGDETTAPGFEDYKTRLQELAAELSVAAPAYQISASGPDHDRTFEAVVRVADVTGTGIGSSKKQAQQAAAQMALIALEAESEQKTRGTGSLSGQSAGQPATVPSGGTQ